MDEPENIESVWPHTEMVLFLIDSDTCFGESVADIMEEILDCEHINNEGRHVDNGLSADAQQFPQSKISQDEEIIPHSLLLIHCDLIINTKMEDYLNGTTIPSGTRVVAIVDEPEHPNPVEQLDMLQCSLEKASTKEDVLDEAEDYFRTICPECNGLPARSWVFQWRKGVYHRVHN